MGFGRMKKRRNSQKRDLGFSMHRKMRRVLIGHKVFFKRKGEGFSWEGSFQKESVLTNKRGRVLQKRKKEKKEKDWVEQGKLLKEN